MASRVGEEIGFAGAGREEIVMADRFGKEMTDREIWESLGRR
jgi:hypothetical protein